MKKGFTFSISSSLLMSQAPYTEDDFRRHPLMFYYELTQACDLVCKHCRASAQEEPHPQELTTDQSKALIDQVATFPRAPMIVMTGGDPLKRADLFELIRVAHYAVQAGAAQSVAASEEAELVELRVEPFEENPQVESIFLADDLEIDLDVPLYLDVGP